MSAGGYTPQKHPNISRFIYRVTVHTIILSRLKLQQHLKPFEVNGNSQDIDYGRLNSFGICINQYLRKAAVN